jgi:hypothetical protein
MASDNSYCSLVWLEEQRSHCPFSSGFVAPSVHETNWVKRFLKALTRSAVLQSAFSQSDSNQSTSSPSTFSRSVSLSFQHFHKTLSLLAPMQCNLAGSFEAVSSKPFLGSTIPLRPTIHNCSRVTTTPQPFSTVPLPNPQTHCYDQHSGIL